MMMALGISSLAVGQSALADACNEPNDSESGACKLAPDAQVEGFIESFADIDLYAVDLPDAANLRVDMVPPGDFRLSLQGPDGNVLVRPVGEGTAPRQIRYRNPTAGRVFIKVHSAQGDASSELPYTLKYSLEPDGAGGTDAALVPLGPGLTQSKPTEALTTLEEAGRDATRQFLRDGKNADGAWAEVRYERPRTFRGFRSGWVTVFSRVTVTDDVASAQRLYRDVAAQDYPEATEARGPEFDPKLDTIGDESSVKANCPKTCIDEEPMVHIRIVFREANAVAVLYTWGMGGTDGSTAESAAWLAQQMAGRI
jgi:hypothetical protein